MVRLVLNIRSLIFVGFLILSISPGGIASAASPPNLCVNPSRHACFSTIGAAVRHAPAGATIDVAPGTYAEEVTISTTLTLNGAYRQSVIDATGLTNGIYVDGASAAGTTIKGFAVENANFEGILIQDTNNVTASNNTVQNNDKSFVPPSAPGQEGTCPGNPYPFLADDCGEGLHLLGTATSTVRGNLVQNNVGGILLSDETNPTHNNLIVDNIVQNNSIDCGITLPSHPSGIGPNGPLPGYGVYNNVIAHNVSKENGGAGIGIFAPTPGTAAYNNVVMDNTATNNGLPGVSLHSHAPDQNLNGNQIIGNNLSGNAGDGEPGTTSATTGIEIFSDTSAGASPITNTIVRGNTISNESIDVWVGTTATNLALIENNFLGPNSTIGVENAGTGSVNAAANYWGCPAGPGATNCTSVQGTVSDAPWLAKPFK